MRLELPGWAVTVIEDVARRRGVETGELRDAGRLRRSVVRVRSEAVYEVRSVGDGTPSFPELGRYFGRDHTSLIASDQKYRASLKHDVRLQRRVDALLNQHNET
jgi:chromosomal replication initiator protein